MKMESAPSVQAISKESIICVAVKEYRHQNIMSSVALKKGVKEPWTLERVVQFIELLGYLEITLKSDTEPATIAFRNRAAAMCKAEVTTDGNVLRGIIRTIKCHIESRTQEPLSDDSLVIPWLVKHAGASCPGARKVETEGRYLRGCTARRRRNSLSRLERRCWQDKSPRIRGTG